jgi:very-short-patch-repair endonuclease
VWAGIDASVHLTLPPHGRRDQAHVTHDLAGARIRFHWSPLLFPAAMTSSWLVSPMDAIWQAIHCLDEENAIACLESAVHEGFLTQNEVRIITDLAPARLQEAIAEMEFTAGSGVETLIRRKLRRAGYSVEAQVRVAGVGDEDLVVEDCVALESDGKKWHGPDRFHQDRRRDLKTEGLGRRTLRVTYALVMFEWDSTLATIDRVVADAKREQSRRNGRIVIHPDDPY